MTNVKWFLAIVGGLIGLLAIGIGALYLIGTIRKETAPFRGEVAAVEQIQGDGDFRVAAYQSFFDLCAAVQTAEAQVGIFADRVEDEPGNGEARTNLDAARANRARLIAQYNGLASRDWTQGQFRDADLPYQIDPTVEATSCAA